MRGSFWVPRSIWDDPFFKPDQMTQTEAWIWLTAEAAYAGYSKNIGGKPILLKRGQLTCSSRFLAKAWKWSEPKVRRFLDKLENGRTITRVTDAGQTVITICDYDNIQSPGRAIDAGKATEPTHGRRTDDANDDKGKTRLQNEEEGACARESDFLIQVRQTVGLSADPVQGPPCWTDPAALAHLDRWKGFGLTEADILAEAKASRAKNPEPPDGPKALDRWMERAAKAKTSAAAPAPDGLAPAEVQKVAPKTPEERLLWFAEKINDDTRYFPPNGASPQLCRALLDAGLVTPEQLRKQSLTF